MFSKVFSSALTLQIGGHSFQFKSTQELEFVLTGRTTPSPQKAATIVGLSDSDLALEADAFRRMESLVGDALAQAVDDPDTVDHFLRELDHSLVEEDNNWRDLLLALSGADSRYAAFKLTAISSYRTYLNAGQDLSEAVFAKRRQSLPDPSVVNALLGEPKARQRLVFSITDILGHEPAKLEFTRLPKGEPVAVNFGVHQSLSLMLAKHKFILVAGEPWLLIDPTGNESRLYESTAAVGRHPDADVIIYAGYRSVSRKHLLIQTDGVHKARLTDTSSMGTFAALHETDGVVH